MAALFKRGDKVVLAAAIVVPSGPIVDIKMNDDGDILYLMEWVDPSGATQARWFAESELAAA